jgi:hypothetical protein
MHFGAQLPRVMKEGRWAHTRTKAHCDMLVQEAAAREWHTTTKCKRQDKKLHARTTCTGGVAAVASCASRRLTMAACPASQAAHRGQPSSGCASTTRSQHSMRSSCSSKKQSPPKPTGSRCAHKAARTSNKLTPAPRLMRATATSSLPRLQAMPRGVQPWTCAASKELE